jgi:hypothetical protein
MKVTIQDGDILVSVQTLYDKTGDRYKVVIEDGDAEFLHIVDSMAEARMLVSEQIPNYLESIRWSRRH